MEQDGPVKSVILSGQKKVSAPPPLEPGEASGTPQATEPGGAQPGLPGQTPPVPPEGLNGLPVCQSKQDPWAGRWGTACADQAGGYTGHRGGQGTFSLWTFHWGRPAKGFAKELSRPHHYGYTSKWLHSQRTRPKGPF